MTKRNKGVDELKKSKRGTRDRTGAHARNNRGTEDVQQYGT